MVGVDWIDVLAAAALGSACLGCRRPGRPWCAECLEDLRAAVDPHPVGDAPPAIACMAYAGCVPEAVVGFKDRNVRALGPAFGDIVALGVEYLGARAVLVPAPSSPAAVRRRGFAHTLEITRHAAAMLGLPVGQLLRSRRRKDQAGLSPAARRSNLEGSMWVPHPGREEVIVIDDVRTSGATLAECGRALRQAGYRVVGNVVVASAQG